MVNAFSVYYVLSFEMINSLPPRKKKLYKMCYKLVYLEVFCSAYADGREISF